MKLSHFSTGAIIIRDSDFFKLGYVDSSHSGVLACADSLKFSDKSENVFVTQ